MNRLILMALLAASGCSSVPAGPEHGQGGAASMQVYAAQRAELFDRVYEDRLDRAISLTPEEIEVDRHLADLKAEVFGAGGHEWPAESFFLVKERLERTDLFRFLRAMPKGGVLHMHAGAMGSFRWIVDVVSHRPDCWVLRGEDEGFVRGALRLSETAPGDAWVRVEDERRAHGDADAYDKDLYQDITLGVDDLSRPDMWTEFGRKFALVRHLYSHDEIVEGYLRDAIEIMVTEDNVQYMEVRTGPGLTVLPALRAIRDDLRASGVPFDLRVIVNVIRYREPGESDADTADRFAELMRRTADGIRDNPDLVVGFDLVAEEDPGLPASFFAEPLLALRAELGAAGMELPLFLHAGESNRPPTTEPLECELSGTCGLPINNNLFDAALLGSKRVGHGLALAKLPGLMEEYRRRDICIEVCPISNQILGYVNDLRHHPAITLMNAGLPITLSSDDPAIFQYRGVSHDFWMATVAWNLDLRTLKQLAVNSIRYSALPAPQKSEMMALWEAEWAEFIRDRALMPD